MGQRYGVDVSSNNTHPIAWAALYTYLKNLGGGATPFAIIKITEATNYVNPDQAVDVAAARAAGFVVAGYLFDHGNVDPTQEVNYFNAHASGLPLFDDLEDPCGLTAAQYAAHSQMLMSIPSSEVEYLNQSEVAEGFPHDRLWLAQYNNAPGTVAYPCLIHQYADQQTVAGCSGVFDVNVWLGTEDQFNAHFHLGTPAPAMQPLTNCLGGAYTPTGNGYWLVQPDGGVFTHGDALYYGSMGGQHLNAPVVGFSISPTGKGYWLVASDGGIFNFGDAAFFGSEGGKTLNKPITGIMVTPDAKGYSLVGGDGGIFTHGDALFEGAGQ